MTPQFPSFNKGIWKKLEEMVRDWARVKGKIYVISGSIFDKNNDGHRDSDADANRVAPTKPVAVPTHFYKIIVRNPPLAQAEAIAILLPHDQSKHLGAEALPYLTQHITTIKRIEDLTGITFFPTLAASKRATLENAQAATLWPTK
jgi:endonuclease G